jgi:hypothetical protein
MNYQQRGLRALFEYRINKRLGLSKQADVSVPEDALARVLNQLADENRALKLQIKELDAQLTEARKPSRQAHLRVDLLEFSKEEQESYVVRALCQELLNS